MAQTGIATTLTSINIAQLGKISGGGGLIGAVITGFPYYPTYDDLDFNAEKSIIVIDKINTVSNLPNRIDPNEVRISSYVIDMYIGLVTTQTDFTNEIDISLVDSEVCYIPSQYVTSILALPGLDCCDATTIVDGDGGSEPEGPPTLVIVPEIGSSALISYFATPGALYGDVVEYTLSHTNLIDQLELILTSEDASGGNPNPTEWRKGTSGTWLTASSNPIIWSLAETAATANVVVSVRRQVHNLGIASSTAYQSNFLAQSSGINDTAEYHVNVSSAIVGCFIAGTRIQLINNSFKYIEDIDVEDMVLTYNEDTKLNELGVVGDLQQHSVSTIIRLTFDNGNVITTTPMHPFFIKDGWINANELKAGDICHGVNGESLVISNAKLLEEPHEVYNLISIAPNHNFYANEVLVHNKPGDGPPPGGP
jgi:hypothetical protein